MSSPYYRTPHWRNLQAACFARDSGMCTAPGCGQPGVVADHIQTRPNVPHPCALDVIENLRLLCLSHDAQVKEAPGGKRKQQGRFKMKGCDTSGRSLDPK